MRITPLVLAAAAALLAGSAGAQTLITHDKALAGNVSAGDAAGYPITLSQPGSYKLMSNLIVPAGKNGIEIAADEVSLDLNGFAIIGAGSCTTDASGLYTALCNGTGYGIVQSYPGSQSSLVVRNGTVEGFGWGLFAYIALVDGVVAKRSTYGIALQSGHAHDVLVTGNRYGLYLVSASAIQATARGNGYGFIGGDNGAISVVRQSSAIGNGTGASNLRTSGLVHIGNAANESNTQPF